jgi:predicted transcriptional regulator
MSVDVPGRVTRARRRVAELDAQHGLEDLQQMFCEPTRLRIVQALTEEPLTVTELAAVIGRRIPATSQHLRVLRQLGLVAGHRQGTTISYCLKPGPMTAQLQAVLDVLQPRGQS